MKPTIFLLVFCTSFFGMSCNREKKVIDDANKADKEAINLRKQEVKKAADRAMRQADQDEEMDKMRIVANHRFLQAQLQVDKITMNVPIEAEQATGDEESR
jgi:hypothetical protein